MDTNKPNGYVLAAILQYQSTEFVLLLVASMLTILIGSYFIGLSLCRDIQNDLRLMNASVKKKQHRTQRMLMQLRDFAQFNTTLKQFSS